MNRPKPVTKKIDKINFNLLSPEQIKNLSQAKVVTPELYDIDGYPVDGGLMDLRMGAVDPGVRCRTCAGTLKDCVGHPGSIDLARPVIHLKYISLIELGLRGFCQECNKLMVSEKDLEKYPSHTKRAKKAKNVKKCPYCATTQERIKLEKPTNFYRGKTRIYPTEIRELLTKVPDEELEKIGVNPQTARPEWAIMTTLLVPPVTVRPSIILETGERSEDDLTHKLSDIIRANQRLWENLNAGAPEVIVEDLWDLLQFHVTTFFDNTTAKVPPARHRSGQPLKTITSRIKGKEGRIRKNIAGKRVNFSGRTVISPEPYMDINEVGVPEELAKVVTTAETVTDLNIEKAKKLIEQGREYPGANYVIRPDGRRKKITSDLKEEIINEIEPGYIVERHLVDGDIILFNRQPSLHKGSLMSHYVRILPGKTLRVHPSVCPPYGADFDGDEMNIHVPQNEEAKAEAKALLDVKQNLMSPKNGTNFVGCIKDAITGDYLVSLAEFSREEASQLLFQAGKELSSTKKKISGKELLSEILPKETNFSNNSVEVKDGKIQSGVIDKSCFADEDGELIAEIDKSAGRDETFNSIDKAFKIGNQYATEYGVTASAEDFKLDESVMNERDKEIKKAKKKTQEIIDSYQKGELEPLPGKSLEESREIKILQTLNEVRTNIGQIVKEKFPEDNVVNKMIQSGGGGNMLSITQISCCVGQQALWGGRVDIGYSGRTLPFFKKDDLSPEAKGFIKNSFMEGLRPEEFFFSSMVGRDSLMDVALRTPKSGYLYRRLANAFQDFRSEYDGTVRDSNNNIIQFQYGGDNKDVSNQHTDKNVAPGEGLGLIAAQSFGESATQMTLDVFHFAGVSEMQVTMGLARMIEIFDARKKPSSPKMEIYLNKDYNDEKNAELFAENLKEVRLKEIASEIAIDFNSKKLDIKIDNKSLGQTHTTVKKVVDRLNEMKYSAKDEGKNHIGISVSESSFREIYKIKEKIKEAVISGIKGISQVLVVKRGKDYVVVTLGTNLKEMLKMKEVDGEKIMSNDLFEVANVFGIEAARALVVDELNYVVNTQGIGIDRRHIELSADALVNTGYVKGVTRMGIIAQKSSILARATFETPVNQFVRATVKGEKEELSSVIENIILNQPVPVGTGLPGLLVKVVGPLQKSEKEKEQASEKAVEKAANE
ncbi:MAG: DNA-directed RNA polymerase subunit A' [Candidatus Pacearchaeota archaeon]